jgi:alpha-L-fucosidase 2
MNHQKLVLFLFLLLFSVETFAQKTAKFFVPSYKGIFASPARHIPTAFTPDAPIAGNGDVGIVLGGSPAKQCIYISKNDFWKAKNGYPEGGVCLPGGLNISIPQLEGATFYAEQVLANGNINAVFKKDGLTFTLKAFVPSGSNMVILEMASSGKPCNVALDIWSQTGFESRNESGEKDGIFYTMRHFDSPDLDWPSHVALAMKTLGAKGKSFVLSSSSKVIVVVGICTNNENVDYLSTACSRLKNTTLQSVGRLDELNSLWWKKFWAKSHVEIGDTLLEKYYYGSQYLLASCSRNKDFAPGLCGNSITADAISAWQGDYHTNYNFEAPWWACYSSNHIELTEPYDKPILDYMQKAKIHARELLSCKGVYYPVGIGPKAFSSSMYPLTQEKMMKNYGIKDMNIEGGHMFCGQRSNAVMLTANMFLRFYHTYDREYALKVYPFIHEVADFWDDYLKYENGQYNSYNDNFWEVGPWTENWRNDLKSGDINNTNTLGWLKMFYKGIIEMSTFLNVDKDRVEKWKHIQQHLYPVPTIETDGMVRIKAAERGASSGSEARTKPGFGRVMAYSLVFPSGISGVKTDSAFASILCKEIGRWDTNPGGDATWKNLGNGFETYFTSAIRVGYNPDTVIAKLKERIAKTALPNLWIPQDGGLTETLSAVPSCINEMLLQSYEGMIRVFPAWRKDARFENLRTYGAFLVSSEKMKGDVQYISITSEKGQICTVENPWNGKIPTITENGKPVKPTVKGNLLTFPTREGKVYLIENIKF